MLPTITVDIGTTSVKFRCLGSDGRPLVHARLATPTIRDRWGEVYDPEALTGALSDFVRSLEPAHRSETRRIAITGVGESGGLVRADRSLASPIVVWHDQRGASRLTGLDADARSAVYRRTGLPVSANYGLSKAAWAVDLAGSESRGAQWLNVAEYLAATLTGVRWAERTLASRVMALDLVTRTWSPEICGLVGIDVGVFPPVRTADHGEPLMDRVARNLGLPIGTMVHVAGHDHMVGAVGADLARGELLNSTGTTEGLLVLQEAPSTSAEYQLANLANGLACRGSDFTLFASIPTGGSAFATLGSLLAVRPRRLETYLREIHGAYLSGQVDLSRLPLVLPAFRGSPPPEKAPTARGAISGIGHDTSAADLVLACFLGLTRQFLDVLGLFPGRPSMVKVIGPATGNRVWLQLKADMLGAPLSASAEPEVVSQGAQALASGEDSSWASCRPELIEPNQQRHERLLAWCDETQAQWAHLKRVPV